MNCKERLQLLRKQRGFSQEALADALGVARQTVGKWETGQAIPGVSQLVALSELYGVTIDSLLKDAAPCGQSRYEAACADIQTIVPFLLRAKRRTYAAKAPETSACRPASHDFCYQENGCLYYDSYLGGERFAGEEAVWMDGRPVWSMNYMGRVLTDGFEGDFLKEALLRGTVETPWRGPVSYAREGFLYTMRHQGDMAWFQGEETITRDGATVYTCLFHGGLLR